MLKARKLYQGDIMYAEGDLADEIIFVFKGSFYLYKDICDMVPLPDKVINKETQAFNVPFVRYAGGSYFGDEDCLLDVDLTDSSENKKYWRQCTV